MANTMYISLRTMKDEPIALVPITTDEHGYLYATHPALAFEVECALYGYQEGRVEADTLEDADGNPYMIWRIIHQGENHANHTHDPSTN